MRVFHVTGPGELELREQAPEHPGVGGGDVGVGAEDGAGAAVEVEAHGLLLAGRLGVEVDQDHPDLRRQLRQQPVGGVDLECSLL